MYRDVHLLSALVLNDSPFGLASLSSNILNAPEEVARFVGLAPANQLAPYHFSERSHRLCRAPTGQASVFMQPTAVKFSVCVLLIMCLLAQKLLSLCG